MPTLSDAANTTSGERLDEAGITDTELSALAMTGITDAELSALAMAADPDAPLGPDAIPVGLYLSQSPGLLPQWYMPQAMLPGARWRTVVVVMIIAAFLLIDAAGLCSTYGHIVIA